MEPSQSKRLRFTQQSQTDGLVSKEDLDKAMSKDEVGEEISLVVDQLNSTAGILPIFINLNTMNKSVRIDKLIELQRLYFAKDKEAKDRLEAAARKAVGEKYPDLASDSSLDIFTDKMYTERSAQL